MHFTTFVNILPKLRYFEDRNYIQIYKLVTRVIQFFCFLDKPMKGGDILDFSKGGNLRKEGLDLERGGGCMTPLTNYVSFKIYLILRND